MQNRYSVISGVCFWLVLIFFGLRYFLSDWSGQGRKETSTNKPAVSAVSTIPSGNIKPKTKLAPEQKATEQGRKETATNKPAAVSAASHLSKFPALRKYVESLRPIPAGSFQMGSTTGDPYEKPVHRVTLSAFRLGATPVTVALWKEYCAATGTELPEAPAWGLLDDHPVVNVSWNDIMGVDGKGGFCAWASDIAGFRLTLPTEAQFEYASRGGKVGFEYPWGNSFDDDSKLWCSKSTKRTSTAPVIRSYNIFENAYDLTDMSGNVYQWCSDYYGPYSGTSQNDPTGPSSTSDNVRCVRGGSWFHNFPDWFRCANRIGFSPDFWIVDNGFRLSAGTS